MIRTMLEGSDGSVGGAKLTSLTGEVVAEEVSIECLSEDVLDCGQDQLTRSDKVICFSLKSCRHTLEPVPGRRRLTLSRATILLRARRK